FRNCPEENEVPVESGKAISSRLPGFDVLGRGQETARPLITRSGRVNPALVPRRSIILPQQRNSREFLDGETPAAVMTSATRGFRLIDHRLWSNSGNHAR